MNQKFVCSLTATLLMATLGTPASNAGQPDGASQSSNPNQDPALIRSASLRSVTPVANPDVKLGERSSQSTTNIEPQPPSSTPSAAPTQRSPQKTRDVIKVGERQSSKAIAAEREVTAKIYAHDYEGRPAATLYVRNIPVLTFLGSAPSRDKGNKVGTQAAQTSRISIAPAKSLATSDASIAATELSSTATAPDQDDPVWRASALAAQLNQMSRDSLDADKITVTWVSPSGNVSGKERYRINVNNTVLATVDAQTILPNSTRNLETDALEATNLMRRLMGNAAPLSAVAGKPKPPVIAIGPIRLATEWLCLLVWPRV